MDLEYYIEFEPTDYLTDDLEYESTYLNYYDFELQVPVTTEHKKNTLIFLTLFKVRVAFKTVKKSWDNPYWKPRIKIGNII